MPRQRTLIETALAVKRGEVKIADLPERTRKRVEAITPSLGDAGVKPAERARVPFATRATVRRARSA